MLAAMGGAERPTRASDGYVRATFDDFAESFDRNLEELGYRAPQLLFDAVTRSGALQPGRVRGQDTQLADSQPGRVREQDTQTAGLQSPGRIDVLDIGCGTGLCGPLLRPMARRLVGVDLSPNMLSKAAARAVYDQLNCAELTQWLAECGQQFGLAVAADVLCYFGDLSAAFANVRAVLAPGGCFACSLEAQPGSAGPLSAGSVAESSAPEPFVLLPHGRYQHDRKYVEASLAAAGLDIVSISNETLRHERQHAVVGLVIVARRSDLQAVQH
jgi:predicted TPR repeat methyltransferase